MLKIEDIKPGVRLKALAEIIRHARTSHYKINLGNNHTFIVSELVDDDFIRGYFDADPYHHILGFYLQPDRFDFDLGIISDKIPNQVEKSGVSKPQIRFIRR